jgi:aspartyl-tRNA(Asn)/glutamyl-tRNA(Gln) amidotransferase subunit B
MDEGQMRVEANISISLTDKFGTKVEVKNINSFKAVEGAINYELKRHEEVLLEGGKIVQETRGWNEDKQTTFSQRKKENAHDYRYFPEPDLPKLKLSEVPEFASEKVKASLPELPWDKRARLLALGLSPDTAEIFVADMEMGRFFDAVSGVLKQEKESLKLASNYISSDLLSLGSGIGKVTAESFASLIGMIKKRDLSSRGGKDVLAILHAEGGEPQTIAKEKSLIQKNDPEALKKTVGEILAANPKVAADYKAGKEALLQFFVGQGMKATKGSGNPQVLAELFREALK